MKINLNNNRTFEVGAFYFVLVGSEYTICIFNGSEFRTFNGKCIEIYEALVEGDKIEIPMTDDQKLIWYYKEDNRNEEDYLDEYENWLLK